MTLLTSKLIKNQKRKGCILLFPVLLCPDVKIMLRISHNFCHRVVINYDFPTGVEDYVHRIGRTGRASTTGLAYTFFSDQDAKYASDLIKILEGAN